MSRLEGGPGSRPPGAGGVIAEYRIRPATAGDTRSFLELFALVVAEGRYIRTDVMRRSPRFYRKRLASAWTKDEAFARFGGRMEAHDTIDAELGSWCANRDADDVATLLSDAGVPAQVVVPAAYSVENAQLRHRRLFEDEDHPVTGHHPIPGLPFRFSHVDRWARRPSPTIGQHNDEVLGEVATAEELSQLRAAGVIGEGLAR